MNELYEKAAKAAFENAKDLIDDAELLLTRRRYARSKALLVLASEEFAKLVLYKVYSYGLISAEEEKEFEKAIRDHTPKIKIFTKLMSDLSVALQHKDKVIELALNQKKDIAGILETLKEEIAQDEIVGIFETANQVKKAAFYVDISGNKVLLPKDVVTEEDCRKTIKILREKAILRFKYFLDQKDSDVRKTVEKFPSLFEGTIAQKLPTNNSNQEFPISPESTESIQ